MLFRSVQMKGCRCVRPNRKTHLAFAEALWKAQQAGVKLRAFDCLVTESTMLIQNALPVEAEPY